MSKRIIASLTILFILLGLSSCRQAEEEKNAANTIIFNENDFADKVIASAPKEEREKVEKNLESVEYRGRVWEDLPPIAQEEYDYDEINNSFYGNVRYEPSTKTITVSGRGKVSNLYFKGNIINDWHKQKETVKTIVFEEGITEISNCFSDMKSVEIIKFPKSLKNIYGSFSGTKALRVIKFPESLKCISGSFKDASALKEIVIPANVERIEEASFENSALGEIEFKGSVYIGHGAFNCLLNLKRVVISKGSVCEGAFRGCINLQEVVIEKNVKLKNWYYCEEDCDPVIEENFVYAIMGDPMSHYPKAYLYLPTEGKELPWGEGGRYKPIIVPEGKNWEDYRSVPMERRST